MHHFTFFWSKIPKILTHTLQSLRIILACLFLKRHSEQPVFIFGFSRWKTFIHEWFPGQQVILAPPKVNHLEFFLYWRWVMLRYRNAEVLSWQYKGPPALKGFCRKFGFSFRHVEDGFVRSVKLGALHVPPLSLAFDNQDMYFSAGAPTDLEDLIANYDFQRDRELMHRARILMERMVAQGFSKYNSGKPFNANEIYGLKTGKRVLVLGQVERDASIAYGCSEKYNNYDLLKIALEENPNAQLIYKPHPEVASGIAPVASSLDDILGQVAILEGDFSLSDCLNSIDHVYTITSLSGFEALLRGIRVTTLGCPFYAGWGLTDDRQPNERRKRRPTVTELFAAAYILYPKYFDPTAKRYIELEDALDIIGITRATGRLTQPRGDLEVSAPVR